MYQILTFNIPDFQVPYAKNDLEVYTSDTIRSQTKTNNSFRFKTTTKVTQGTNYLMYLGGSGQLGSQSFTGTLCVNDTASPSYTGTWGNNLTSIPNNLSVDLRDNMMYSIIKY